MTAARADGVAQAKGLAWLQGQVLPSGKLASKSRFGTAAQSQCEVAQTLMRLAGNNSQVTALVNAMPSSGDNLPTETLACWQSLKTQQGVQITSPLAGRFIADKGFATYPDEMVPGIIDTAWGYSTLAAPAAATRQGVMQWLMSKQSGGMLKAGGYANLYTTAVVLRAINADALKDAGTLALAQTLAQALLAKQAASGAWGESQMLTALVFEAVHPYTASTPQVASQVQSYLLGQQKPDGSWEADSYTTALALRALALVGLKPTDPGQQANSGTVMGVVLDGSSNTPLENATVTVTPASGAAPIAVQTDAQGLYEVLVSPAGQVGVAATKEGYSLVSGSGVVQARGSLSFSPTLTKAITVTPPANPDPAETTVTVQGTVTQAANAAPMAGVSVTVKNTAAGTSYQATTNATGQYSIANVAAGAVVLSADKAGFVSASGTANLPAGSTGVFSPALIDASSAGATSVPVAGQVVDAISKAPLAGVAITIQGPSSQTAGSSGADGKFTMTAPIGAITLKYALAGYSTISQSGTSTVGSRLDAGVIEMSAARQTSVLHGLVTDTSGAAVPHVTVAVGAISAVTNAAGAYVLDGLTGTAWEVQVSASGFQSRSYQLTIAEPGDITQDFVIPASAGVGFLDLADLVVAPTSTGLNQALKAQVMLKNSSVAASTTSIVLEIQGPAGDVVATLSALDAAAIPLGDATLNPGESLQVFFEWNTAGHAAGRYAVVAKLVEPGSRGKDNPTGVVTGSLRSGLSITAEAAFSGSATAEPPVVQAGANTPVAFSALVKNAGNVVLPAAGYLLRVSDSTTGALVYQTTAQGPSIALGALQEISFGTWMPDQAASLKVEVTAGIAPGAAIQSSLYVGDMAKAEFTVDKHVVPPGDQSVKAKIKITGLDMASGSSTDPLAPVIREAVTKAVRYGDSYAYQHHVSDLKCFACHVQTQAVVGGEKNLRFVQPLDQNKRNELMNAILQQVREDGKVNYSGETYIRTTTTLGLWATKEWHNPQEIASSNRKLAEAVVSIANNGEWNPDYGGHWWGSTGQSTGINVASLVDYAKLLDQHGPGTVKTNTPVSIAGLSSGDQRLAVAANGQVYVGDRGRQTVYAVDLASAQATPVATGLPIQTLRVLANGKLLIATTSGVYLSDTVGTPVQISSQASSDAMALAGGGYLLKAYGQTKLFKLDDAGNLSEFLNSNLLESTGGQLEQEPDGAILVTNPGQNRVLRFELDGTFRDTPAAYTNGTPYQLVRFGDKGHLLSTSNGLYWYNENWIVERMTFGATYTAAALPDGALLWSNSGSMQRMAFTAANASAVASKIDATLAQSATKLVAGSIFSSSNNADMAFRMMGLSKLREYYQGTARAGEFDTLVYDMAQTLWSRQNSDGGWGNTTGYTTSDPVATAIVGVALDFTNPSRSDPRLRRAIQYVLNQQRADGSWLSNQGLGGSLLSSTWIEIWLPTMLDRLGALDADLVVDFAANTVPANLQPAPTKTLPQADGSTQYLWSFTGITEAGREINFDLALANMAIEELRPAAQIASLKFQNSFVVGEVVSPIVVPRIAANANIGIQALTDKPVYASQESAVFSGPVTNGGVAAREAQVRFTVLDANGDAVATLPLPAAVSVAVGQTVQVSSSWPVSGVLAGDYVLLAELVSDQGVVYGSATAPFKVVGGPGRGNATRISTDKAEYLVGQATQITSRAGNTSSNVVQQDLRAETVVLQLSTTKRAAMAKATTSFQQVESINQLVPAGSREFGYTVPAGQLVAGTYQAQLRLYDSAGTLLSESVTGFQVKAAASCVPGALGAITATPSTAKIGDSIALGFKLNNPGAALANSAVTLRVVNPDSGALLMEVPTPNVSVAASGQWSQNYRWTVPQGAPANVLVIASLGAAGCEEAVATASLKIADGGPGDHGGNGPGTTPVKAVPAMGPAGWLLLSAALAMLAAAGLRRRQAGE
ncbi:hypothetical protein GCM10027276_08330 [Comamonas piscis]